MSNATSDSGAEQPDKPTVISLLNHKGGVGKTTTAINLAGALEYLGHKTLIWDLDPAGNATMSLGHGEYYADKQQDFTGFELFMDSANRDRLPELIIERPEMDLVPAHIKMEEQDLAAQLKFGTKGEARLKYIVEAFREQNPEYDFILIDPQPDVTALSRNTLWADGLLMPVQPDSLDLQGFSRLTRQVTDMENHYDELSVTRLGVLMNAVEHDGENDRNIKLIEDQFSNIPKWKIYDSVDITRPINRKGLSIYANGEPDISWYADNYLDIAEHIIHKFGYEPSMAPSPDKGRVERGGAD